jgi:membrane protease YdiL (CAAX protease family)
MQSVPMARRAGEFVRGILPADRSHWLLLIGATFLFISPSLRWWSQNSISQAGFSDWLIYTFFILLFVRAAGVMAYYLVFVGCQNPTRRLLDSVLLPTLGGIVIVVLVGFGGFRDVIDPRDFAGHSLIDANTWKVHNLARLAANLGTGILFASIGFVFLALFAGLLCWGRTSLPTRLKGSSTSPNAEGYPTDEHHRTMLFVWLMISLVIFTDLPGHLMQAVAYGFVFEKFHPYSILFWRTSQLIVDCSLFALVLFAIGSAGRKMIPSMFRLPPAKYLGLAALMPAAIANALPFVTYLHARIIWSSQGWGRVFPPDLADYLRLPHLDSLWLFPAALVEEIAWRGFLQPRFIRRYGLFRGIFFVGVVWGAFHFAWDFNSAMTPKVVILKVFTRITSTVILSYALAWLTIQSGSIVPAAIVHAAFNAFYYLGFTIPRQNPWWLDDLLWAVAGFILFCYFAPPSANVGA